MEEINYVGEHLWLGQVGHFFLILSFVASLVSAVSYFYYQSNVNRQITADNIGWLRIGRWGFILHGLSVLIIFGLIIFAMLNEWYEYYYVYDHVNGNLPKEYILSAFWEGQEGSFQLWMIWHVILGFVIMSRKGQWEAPVLCMVALAEVFLASMLLGLHIEIGDFAYKLGSNPMVLLRDTMDIPLFTNAEYLNLIKGRGLNPLLQNYWNVIHPPTTFLGFASTTIPFAYAIAGLWTGKHREWLIPGLRWALFSGAVLGTGILMGSFWAYEALTFGGYWAWDPVENGILVPWITLVAGIHTNLIAKNTKYAVTSSYFFYIITFVLVLYAAFLTRSGILGETSVHAFTEMGLEWQLIAFVLFFLFLGFGLLLFRRKSIPKPSEEEALNSREFWMFIGSLVLLFSGVLIIGSTSLPVYNTIVRIFDPNYIGNVIQDAVPHYNRYQIWIGVFIGLLSAFTLFLRYNRAIKLKKVYTRLSIAAILSIVATALTMQWITLEHWQYVLMCWAGWLTVFANLDYIINVTKGNIAIAASATSHLGFGIMLIGILASGANKRHISSNPFMFKEIISQEDAMKYVKLYKNKPLFANGYWMTWEKDTLIDRTRYYNIRIEEVDQDNEVISYFSVRPSSLLSNDFNKVAAFNPDTDHSLTRDIFTNIAALPASKMDVENYHKMEDTMQWTRYDASIGDTIQTATSKIILEKLHYDPTHEEYSKRNHDIGVSVDMHIISKKRLLDTIAQASPALGLDGNLLYRYPINLEDFRMRVRLVDTLMDHVFLPEEQLEYQPFIIKKGEAFDYNGYNIQLTGFNKEATHKNYTKEDGDIAVAANIMISKGEKSYAVHPLYIIRNNQPFSIKDMWVDEGLSVRLSDIDPVKESFEIHMAQAPRGNIFIPVEVAENLPETNYIWFEAREFPGINLFWAGTLLMMIGLFGAWGAKIKK